MPSSVWKPTRAPAFSSAAPFRKCTSCVSSFPPGLSIMMMDEGTPAAAIGPATFHASLTCCSTRRNPNSFARRIAVRMSSWR